MTLPDNAEIKPGQRLTVHAWGWFCASAVLEPEILRVFAATIFPVDKADVPGPAGAFQFTGIAESQHGLGTTLPGRNETVAEFRSFVNQRLSLASGGLGLKVKTVEAGGIPVIQSELEKVAETAKPYLYIGLILVGLGILGYAAFGVSRLVRG